MSGPAAWIVGALALVLAVGFLIYRRRRRLGVWLVNKLMTNLSSRGIQYGFDDAADLVATAAVPYLRTAFAPTPDAILDPATVRTVVSHAAALLGGKVPAAPVAIAPYTVAEMTTMGERTASLARKVLASYGLTVAATDAERLLGAVADRVLAAVPA